MGPRAGLDGRKISSPLGLDPGPSSPWSVRIKGALHKHQHRFLIKSCSLLLGMRTVSDTNCRENQNTYCTRRFNKVFFFFENHFVMR